MFYMYGSLNLALQPLIMMRIGLSNLQSSKLKVYSVPVVSKIAFREFTT